jgi:hypothetical protein
MRMRLPLIGVAIATGLSAAACGSNSNSCDPVAQTGCSDGKVCEEVASGMPACFAPVEVHGKVFDLATGAPIAGAQVVALDVNGSALSDVATTGADGTYKLPVPAERANDGTPAPLSLTLRADAAGYQAFPGGVRTALPIDTTGVTMTGGAWVVQSSVTDLALIAQPGGTPTGAITGKVDVADDHPGVLVVAEMNGKGYVAIADRHGAYTIDDLAAGTYTVSAYARNHVYTGTQAMVTAGAKASADLHLSTDLPGTLTGTADIVAASGGSATSIVVMVESTFDAASGRGVVVPGLRAPDPGMAPNVAGAFTIAGVPPGKYVVLAAFENDGLVRDPDPCISGTAIVHVTVAAGQTVAAPTSFKVTSAITITGPGADMPEAVTAAPTLAWTAYPSTATYSVHVFDSFGNEVWNKDSITGTSVPYAGPLDAGAFYQFHVIATKQGGGGCLISQSEDLRGVFYKQ